jgi:hypothetical protein
MIQAEDCKKPDGLDPETPFPKTCSSCRKAVWGEYFACRLVFLEIAVSLQELETAITQLPEGELTAFAQWFEEYLADVWDRRIEADIKAGRLDEVGRKADADFEAGRCKPL